MSNNQQKSTNVIAQRIVYVGMLFSIAIVTSLFIQLSHPEQKGLVLTVIPYSFSFAFGTIAAFLLETRAILFRVVVFLAGAAIIVALNFVANFALIKILALFAGCYWGVPTFFGSRLFEEEMKRIKKE